MNNRIEQADSRYRQKFSELGIKDFEYIRFESKDKVHFKCSKCGEEFTRGNDLFKGKQTRLICHNCGNGKKPFSNLAEQVLEYYSKGHTDSETINKFGITENDLKNWAKERRVSNGRKFGESSNAVRARKSEEEARRNAELKGYLIFGVWVGGKHYYPVIDLKSGKLEEMRGTTFLSSTYNRKRQVKKRNIRIIDKGITILKLIERDGPHCYICGKNTDFKDKRWGNSGPDYPTIDHVKPVSLGGEDKWDNVKVCCGRCNLKKGASYEKANK